jgi:hypothetical protein
MRSTNRRDFSSSVVGLYSIRESPFGVSIHVAPFSNPMAVTLSSGSQRSPAKYSTARVEVFSRTAPCGLPIQVMVGDSVAITVKSLTGR